jgi:endonuclease III
VDGRGAGVSEPPHSSFSRALAALGRLYPEPEGPPTADPFELVLLENVAYLAAPERRREAFELLREAVGTRPQALLAAKREMLERIAARGILKSGSAAKLKECARIVIDRFGGDLAGAIRGDVGAARRALRAFPGIGGPGADKILLFSGRAPCLAPESNGLRVLVRLGVIREQASYSRTYASAVAAAGHLASTIRGLQSAHLRLQLHGQTLCKRTDPRCEACPLRPDCAHGRAVAPGPDPRVRSQR